MLFAYIAFNGVDEDPRSITDPDVTFSVLTCSQFIRCNAIKSKVFYINTFNMLLRIKKEGKPLFFFYMNVFMISIISFSSLKSTPGI